MKPKIRKILQESNEPHNPHEPNLTITQFRPPISFQNPSANSSIDKKTVNSNAPFDSSMALTVLALLVALFFMGLFSIYIRRFTAAESTADDLTRRHRRRQNHITTPMTRVGVLGVGNNKGVDISTVRSLPVYYYHRGAAKQGNEIENDDCAVCLTEFEEREEVKMIPFCGHVFHPLCIEKWLAAHVSCPLCRTTMFFPAAEVDERSTVENEEENRSTVVRDDTWMRYNFRRINSCSRLGERISLQRTLSF